jgi:hypothetical protein
VKIKIYRTTMLPDALDGKNTGCLRIGYRMESLIALMVEAASASETSTRLHGATTQKTTNCRKQNRIFGPNSGKATRGRVSPDNGAAWKHRSSAACNDSVINMEDFLP